jgi:hypothetical protein
LNSLGHLLYFKKRVKQEIPDIDAVPSPIISSSFLLTSSGNILGDSAKAIQRSSNALCITRKEEMGKVTVETLF